jgi:hypothetical protein
VETGGNYLDNGKNTVKTGCLLGDWSDELGKDVWIVDWVSTGPKSYCYKTKARFIHFQVNLSGQ